MQHNFILSILYGLFNAFCKHGLVANNKLYGNIESVPKISNVCGQLRTVGQ